MLKLLQLEILINAIKTDVIKMWQEETKVVSNMKRKIKGKKKSFTMWYTVIAPHLSELDRENENVVPTD